MAEISIKFLGSGDAFGSGGRLRELHYVATPSARVLIDCGATCLIGMKRYGIDPNQIDAIFLSHLHGDHFGGLPFFVLDAQLVSKRNRPLAVAGPPGLEERIRSAMEVFFPGSSGMPLKFPLEFIPILERRPLSAFGLSVTAFPVIHGSGAPSYALRVECEGKTLVYSGDTEWTEVLAEAAQGCDLLLCEAYTFDKRLKYHLDYASIIENRQRFNCRRIMLTHPVRAYWRSCPNWNLSAPRMAWKSSSRMSRDIHEN